MVSAYYCWLDFSLCRIHYRYSQRALVTEIHCSWGVRSEYAIQDGMSREHCKLVLIWSELLSSFVSKSGSICATIYVLRWRCWGHSCNTQKAEAGGLLRRWGNLVYTTSSRPSPCHLVSLSQKSKAKLSPKLHHCILIITPQRKWKASFSLHERVWLTVMCERESQSSNYGAWLGAR